MSKHRQKSTTTYLAQYPVFGVPKTLGMFHLKHLAALAVNVAHKVVSEVCPEAVKSDFVPNEVPPVPESSHSIHTTVTQVCAAHCRQPQPQSVSLSLPRAPSLLPSMHHVVGCTMS